MTPFNISVENENYQVTPHQQPDQVIYEVMGVNFVCAVGLNEHAEWEANNCTSPELINAIGAAIENHEN